MALIENSPNADSYLAQFIFSRLPYPLRHALFAAHATRKTRMPATPTQTATRRLQTASRRTQWANFSAQI